MWRWLRSLFAWQDVRDTGVWLYQTNAVTLKRRVVRLSSGYQPVDREWVTTGEWSGRGAPPRGGGTGRK